MATVTVGCPKVPSAGVAKKRKLIRGRAFFGAAVPHAPARCSFIKGSGKYVVGIFSFKSFKYLYLFLIYTNSLLTIVLEMSDSESHSLDKVKSGERIYLFTDWVLLERDGEDPYNDYDQNRLGYLGSTGQWNTRRRKHKRRLIPMEGATIRFWWKESNWNSRERDEIDARSRYTVGGAPAAIQLLRGRGYKTKVIKFSCLDNYWRE